MNDDVSEDNTLKNVDSFKKQYAAVLVQLNEVLEQAYAFSFTLELQLFTKENKRYTHSWNCVSLHKYDCY